MSPCTTWGSTCRVPGSWRAGPPRAVDLPPDLACQYAAHRAEAALRLWPQLKSELERRRLSGSSMPAWNCPCWASWPAWRPGAFGLDQGFLRRFGQDLEAAMQRLEREIYALAGEEFLIQSPQQLGRILFEKLKLTPQKKTKGKTALSTDVEVLQTLAAGESHRRQGPGVPQHGQTQVNLRGRPPEAGRPGHRAGAHHLSPVGGGHRAPVQPGPQFAEHPGAGRAGGADSPGLRAGPRATSS